jgi:hypothetical protein
LLLDNSTSTLTMPPNRKGNTDLAQGIANLNVASFVTTTKYQPLTQPQVNGQAVQATQCKSESHSLPVLSYWDWPTDTDSPKQVVVERILEDERIRQLFDIGSNLIAAAEKAASLEEDTVAVTVVLKETDDYWYTPEEEHVEDEVASAASQCVDTASEPDTGAALLGFPSIQGTGARPSSCNGRRADPTDAHSQSHAEVYDGAMLTVCRLSPLGGHQRCILGILEVDCIHHLRYRYGRIVNE